MLCPYLAVGMNLCKAHHAAPAKVLTRFAHVRRRHRVPPGLTIGVREGDRRHDARAVKEPIPIEIRHTLDAAWLLREVVQQRRPQSLRQLNQHGPAQRSEVVPKPRRDDSESRRRCVFLAASAESSRVRGR